jgi:hypothetical protein
MRQQLILPWLATFAFGFVVFVIGKVFQFSERKKRAERKAQIEREQILAFRSGQASAQQKEEIVGIWAAAKGSQSASQGQRTDRTVH